jgi:hypothetical protein
MRQREGRTGRSRPGRVVYLLSEGREQQHYEDNHAKEQLVKVRRRGSEVVFVGASVAWGMVGSNCANKHLVKVLQRHGGHSMHQLSLALR